MGHTLGGSNHFDLELPLESAGKCDTLHRSANAVTEPFHTAVDDLSDTYARDFQAVFGAGIFIERSLTHQSSLHR